MPYRPRQIVFFTGFLALSALALCSGEQQASSPAPSASAPQQNAAAQNYLGISPESTPLYPELKQAHQHFIAHQQDKAAAAYRAVLEKAIVTQDKPAEALAHAGLSSILQNKADYPAARNESEQALALAVALKNPIGVAEVNNSLGIIAYYMGDLKIAQQYLRQALVTFETLGMLREQASTLRSLDMAGAPDGEKLLQQALSIAQKLGDKSMEATLLHNLGDWLFNKGQFDAAQEKYGEAAVIYEQAGDRLGLAYVLTSEGRLQRAHGHPEKAIPIYEQALAAQQEVGDRFGVIQSTNAMAVAYQALEDSERAIELFGRALAMAKETGSKRIIDFEMGNLAAAYNQYGKYQQAVPILQELLRGGCEHADYRYESLGIAYLNLGKPQEAADSLSKAIELSRKGENWDVLPRTLMLRAETEEKLGQQDAALADAEESLRVIEGIRKHVVPTDFMKRGFAEVRQEAFGTYVGLLERSHQPERALDVAEEARSRAFLDLLATRNVEAAASTPRETASPRKAHDEGLRASAATTNPPGSSTGTLLRGDSSEAVGPWDRSNDQDPELRSPLSGAFFSLDQVQATARRLNSTVISYWVATDATYIWVVPPEGASHNAVAKVSRKRLEELIASLGGLPPETREDEPRPQTASVRTQGHASFDAAKGPGAGARARGETILRTPPGPRKRWRELYKILIEPIEAWLPAKTASLLTIEPYGPLLRLPFAALIDAQGRYLLERFSLHYTPAVSLLQFTEKQKELTRGRPASYLLVADPSDMPEGPGESALPRLPGSRREVASIARLLPAKQVTLLTGKQAEEDTVTKLAREKSVIHLATHGIILDDRPFDSYLALGASHKQPGHDGRLTARKIYELDLHADLVFLSACRSGSGKVSGDGLVGLTRAFWYAGTPSVIASLWDVADEPTSRLVAGFYRLRLQGYDKSRALRLAQLRLLRQLRAERVMVQTSAGLVALPEDPMFWAGFVLQGEP